MSDDVKTSTTEVSHDLRDSTSDVSDDLKTSTTEVSHDLKDSTNDNDNKFNDIKKK